jgi:hypothetical protein
MLKVLVDLSSTSHGWGYLAKYISSVNGVKAKSGISSNMQGINSQPISLMLKLRMAAWDLNLRAFSCSYAFGPEHTTQAVPDLG